MVGFRSPPDLTKEIDKWAAVNEISRSEAVRRLVEKALADEEPGAS